MGLVIAIFLIGKCQ